jgi:hypothetical protein
VTVLLVIAASVPQAVAAWTTKSEAVELTREIPPLVRKTCHDLAPRTTLHVVCPPLVPKTRIVHIAGLYGSFSASDLVNIPASWPTAYYEMSFNNGGPFGTVHWVVAKGTPAAVRFYVLSDKQNEVKGRPHRTGVMWVDHRKVEIYRFPWHPAGGTFGSHLAALVRSGPFVYVASIHGYDHARASARMAVAMALADVHPR